MSARPRSRAVALILSVVPGWGHVYWGRERRGLVIFTLFAIGAFALLNGVLVSLGSWKGLLIVLSAAVTLVVSVGAWIDLWLRTAPKRVHEEAEERQRRMREGTIAYLSNEFEKAHLSFRSCLDLDPQDVEAFFRLAVICCREGDKREALRWLRRAQKFDIDRKWSWELKTELERLKETRGAERSRASVLPRRAKRGTKKDKDKDKDKEKEKTSV